MCTPGYCVMIISLMSTVEPGSFRVHVLSCLVHIFTFYAAHVACVHGVCFCSTNKYDKHNFKIQTRPPHKKRKYASDMSIHIP
jgi:hypothetical protein